MNIDLDAIEMVGFSSDENIYDSKLLDLKVPSTTFLQTGMHFVPVDGKTIHDPLFVSDGCMVIGTIVETNVCLKDMKVYKFDIEEDPSVIGKQLSSLSKEAMR